MCEDYRLVNKHTHLNKYAMPLPEEIFDALGQAKVFIILNLRSSYHQLPLREGDKVKTTFWGIDPHGKDCLYQMAIFAIWFEESPCKFSKGDGSSVGKTWFCQVLH
jgi:hypothetical protein